MSGSLRSGRRATPLDFQRVPDLRFYLDENLPQAVADGLRQRGLDVVTVHELGRRGLPDPDHLAHAHELGRVLVTHDQDFFTLAYTATPHSGVLYLPQERSIGELIRDLELASEVLTPAEMANRLEHL